MWKTVPTHSGGAAVFRLFPECGDRSARPGGIYPSLDAIVEPRTPYHDGKAGVRARKERDRG
jgi:hypothetical protein